MIQRRDFVCRLAAGVLLAPLAARSQTATKIRRIGFLSPGQPPTDAEAAASSAQLRALGWVEGQNFAFENRFVGKDIALLRSLAEELVRLKVDMIVTERSDHQTYCPYKGDCTYYSIPVGGQRSVNAVWTYETPYAAVAVIEDHVAFYPDRVDAIEEHPAAIEIGGGRSTDIRSR